jgi:hypothetical protein
MAYDFLKDIVKNIAPAIVGLGAQLVINNQNVQNVKGQANNAREIADLQYKTAYANAQALALANKANAPKVTDSGGSKVPLYIGLGLGGVLVLGLVIYAIRR